MKKAIFLIGCLLSSFVVFSQYNQHFLIATAGNFYNNSEISLSWSLGEVITETFSNESYSLTQGFQQSKLDAVGIEPFDAVPKNEFKLYPNPTTGKFKIDLKPDVLHMQGEYWVQVFDVRGEIICTEIVKNYPHELTIEDKPNGLYFIRIIYPSGEKAIAHRLQKIGD